MQGEFVGTREHHAAAHHPCRQRLGGAYRTGLGPRRTPAQFGVTNPNIEVLPQCALVRGGRAVPSPSTVSCTKRLKGDENLAVISTRSSTAIYAVACRITARACPTWWRSSLMTDAMNAIAKLSGADPFVSAPAVCTWQTSTTSAASRRSSSPSPMMTAATRRRCRRPTSCCSACRARRRRLPPSTWLSRAIRSANVPARSLDTEPPKESVRRAIARACSALMTTRRCSRWASDQRRLGNAAVAMALEATPTPNTCSRGPRLAPARSCENWGAIVIHTENRAVEETAQEILRYYERAHPQGADIVIRS